MPKRTSDSLYASNPQLVGMLDERSVVTTFMSTNPHDAFAHLLDVVEWPALVRAPPHRLRSLLSCSRAPSH